MCVREYLGIVCENTTCLLFLPRERTVTDQTIRQRGRTEGVHGGTDFGQIQTQSERRNTADKTPNKTKKRRHPPISNTNLCVPSIGYGLLTLDACKGYKVGA